ncbi:MAG: hypothetical protein ACTSRI_14035 [Promethearchaeota archaeon]
MKKTNLDIIDQDSWNWVKNQKNYYDLRSVADFIFKIINEYQKMDVEKWLFLINVEKYFEYSYFDMSEFSYIMELKSDKIVKLVDKYLGSDIPMFNFKNKDLTMKIIRKIHKLMIENRILPRELSIAYNLRNFMDKNQINNSNYENLDESNEIIGMDVNNEKILSILFPDLEERRKEMYSEAINYAEIFIKSKESKDLNCLKCAEDCFIKRPDYLYYKSGVDISLDDLKDDLVSEILKKDFKEDYITCYGFCLALTINSLIKKNLLLVKNFIKNELYIFEKPTEITIFIDNLIKISKKEVKSFLKEKELKEYFEEIYEKLSAIA